MGDEVRRTQRGNNNAYCQDNEISWFDWSLLQRHADLYRFVQQLIRFRLNREMTPQEAGLSLNQLLQQAQFEWHGVRLHQPDWRETSHSLAVTARLMEGRLRLHLMLNAYWEPLTFELPPNGTGRRGRWRRKLDTALEAPEDIVPWASAPSVPGSTYVVQSRSVVLLLAQN